MRDDAIEGSEGTIQRPKISLPKLYILQLQFRDDVFRRVDVSFLKKSTPRQVLFGRSITIGIWFPPDAQPSSRIRASSIGAGSTWKMFATVKARPG